LRNRLKTPDYKIETIFDHVTPKMDEAIYTDSRKVDDYHKKYQAYLFYKKINSQRIIKSFDCDAIRLAPDHLQPYATAILPILEFLNKWAFNRAYKTPNLLL
jgi:hypothetical protein